MLEKIVSGGQTGADRTALDWALERNVPHEGWCPAGRRAEDGPIASLYRLRETPNAQYLERTRWNVRDSDATVIFTIAPTITGGSLATLRYANVLEKPVLHLSRDGTPRPADTLRDFMEQHAIRVLNVAGPRASGEPEIGDFVWQVLSEALDEELV